MDCNKPKVFISHASEDKERIVNQLAERLRKNGVDVWVDDDQMLPGDKLIEKIFDEGIAKADVFIIILSQKSVNKPWVKEELQTGYIKRINENMKIIPIVIEDCEIPSFLNTTVWQKIEDLNNYDIEYNRILCAIFDDRDQKLLGEAPHYVKTSVPLIADITKVDTLVLKSICEYSINNCTQIVSVSKILPLLNNIEIASIGVQESLEILNEKGYIRVSNEIGGFGIDIFELTAYGFQKYAKVFIPEFDSTLKSIIITIINLNIKVNFDLAKHLDIKLGIINNVLLVLKNMGYITISQVVGGKISINDVSASAKRNALSNYA